MQTLKNELIRKSIHFSGIGYIPLYLIMGKEFTLAVVGILTILALSLEVLKLRYSIIPKQILRNHEIKGVGSHLYTGLAVTIITALLPMEACFVAIANGILGDGIAGIVKRYSSPIAMYLMFVFSFIFLINLSYYVELDYHAAFLACIAGALAESISSVRGHYINDNFSVPIVSSVVYSSVILSV